MWGFGYLNLLATLFDYSFDYLCDQSIERECHIATKDLYNYTHGEPYDDILIFFVEAWPKTKFELYFEAKLEHDFPFEKYNSRIQFKQIKCLPKSTWRMPIERNSAKPNKDYLIRVKLTYVQFYYIFFFRHNSITSERDESLFITQWVNIAPKHLKAGRLVGN